MQGSFQILAETDNWKDCFQPHPRSQGCKRLLKAKQAAGMMERLQEESHMMTELL